MQAAGKRADPASIDPATGMQTPAGAQTGPFRRAPLALQAVGADVTSSARRKRVAIEQRLV